MTTNCIILKGFVSVDVISSDKIAEARTEKS